jgi:hypothetical protein
MHAIFKKFTVAIYKMIDKLKFTNENYKCNLQVTLYFRIS